MKTIEERAIEYAISISTWPQDNGPTYDSGTELGYIQGAKDQRSIDVGMACEWLRNNLNDFIDTEEMVDLIIDYFKKAMEE